MKNLCQDELCQLQQAKQNEIRQYLQNEVIALRFELEKADVSGAFLQGRQQQENRCVVPVNGLLLCCESYQENQYGHEKLVHSLVGAPREWVGSVYEAMKSTCLQQCTTDPCVRMFVKGTS